MKKTIILSILCLIAFCNVNVRAIGSINLSTSTINVTSGKKATFAITAKNCAGLVEIVSSDSSIVSVNHNNYFFDTSLGNSKLTITVTAKNTGKATVKVILKDVASFDGEEIVGTKVVNVNVNEPSKNNTNNASANNNTNEKNTKQEEQQKKMSVRKIEIVGYEINFQEKIYEYTINVPQSVNELYVIVDGDNYSAVNDKKVDIRNKDFFEIILSNENETKKYKVNIKRENPENTDVITDTNNCPNNNSNDNNSSINYVVILLDIVNLIAIIALIIILKSKKTVEY